MPNIEKMRVKFMKAKTFDEYEKLVIDKNGNYTGYPNVVFYIEETKECWVNGISYSGTDAITQLNKVLTDMINTNTSNIATNKSGIDTNKSSIANLTTKVNVNTSDIASNKSNITKVENATNLVTKYVTTAKLSNGTKCTIEGDALVIPAGLSVGVVQKLGQSITEVPSQKLLSDELENIYNSVQVITEEEYNKLEIKNPNIFYFTYEED